MKFALAFSVAINIILIFHFATRKIKVAFVGDSITEALPSDNFTSCSSFNWGVSGYSTYDVKKLISKVARSNPRKIFIQIGINDLWYNLTVDSAFSNFQETINVLLREHREIDIYVSSLFPTGQSYTRLNPALEQLNKRIELFCKQNRIIFINMYPSFLANGKMNEKYTIDGLHLSPKGYEVWMDSLRVHLK